MFKRTKLALAMALSTALLFTACSGTSPAGNSVTESSTTSEADAERSAAEEEARKAEEEAKAAEEAAKKEEEERLAVEAALQAELEEYGIESVKDGVLAEIAEACEKEDYETAWSLMRTEEYDAEAHALETSGEGRKIVQTPSGRIGIFHADGKASILVGDYFIYYGDFAGDQREGHGVWMEVDYVETREKPEFYYIYDGEWANDLPNGAFRSEATRSDGTLQTKEGSVVDGYHDGEIFGTNSVIDQNGEITDGTSVYINGYLSAGKEAFEEYMRNGGWETLKVEVDDGVEFYVLDDGSFYPKDNVDHRSGIFGFY